jgi:hypothetical protein
MKYALVSSWLLLPAVPELQIDSTIVFDALRVFEIH